MKLIKRTVILTYLIFCICTSFAQEALKSMEENYYDMLSLCGITERPYLSYRTLSDNVYNFIESDSSIEAEGIIDTEYENDKSSSVAPIHPWQNHVLNPVHTLWEAENPVNNYFMNGIKQGVYLKIYGPEWYNSYNTAAPFGWYDGALWQGRGYNTSFTAGARLEGYGLEITLKPKINFSQNIEYDYMKPEGFKAAIYSGKADTYGYCWGSGCDAVQRFGDKSFRTFEWGDTEIRYTWRCWTIGFGTQPVWLGPNYVNPLLLSNNSASFPKFDFGIRKQKIILPILNWDLGYIEGRIWTGYLTESDYFDSRDDNDHNLLHGLSLSYAPSFIPGLILNANRTCLVKASRENMSYIIPKYINTHLGEKDAGEDQKMSITADWYFPKVQFEVYGELGIDDFLPAGESYVQGYLRWPFHTASYTIGAKQGFNFKKRSDIKGELILEWNNTEPSQDYQMWAVYNFGHHGQILQGYTNRGEWLGSGIGYGGNSQYLSYSLYYPQGNTTLFMGRFNPDNSYIFGKTVYTSAISDDGYYRVSARWLAAFKAHAYIGADTNFFVTNSLTIGGGFLYDLIINPKYNPEKDSSNRYRINTLVNNFQFKFTAKYSF